MIVSDDLNAQVGNNLIPNIISLYRKQHQNNNRKNLIQAASSYKMYGLTVAAT